MLFCNIKYYVIRTFTQNEIRAWVGRALALQGLWRLIALTFASNTCLMKVSVCICLDFQSLINRLCAKFHIAIFSPSCWFVLPFRTEHSTYFILSKVCHFVGRLKHKNLFGKND